MTIAACFVTPEGVVFGADSTATAGTAVGNHYYDHTQKLFEIGVSSTLAGIVWGLGGLPSISYRHLFASLGDKLKITPPASVEAAINQWTDDFWVAYMSDDATKLCVALSQKIPFDASLPVNTPNMRKADEDSIFTNLKINLIAGVCIGGYVEGNRTPTAYSVTFDPLSAKPVPKKVEGWMFWGTPNIVQRIIFGCDDATKASIISSGKWTGTEIELTALIEQHQFGHPIILPIRDAVDFVHSCISATIKTLKFSNLSQTCGGPIEIAVITADRQFRWVRHKAWDSAISDGGT